MKSSHRVALFCAPALMLALPLAAQEHASPQVGWIEKFDGNAADYGIFHRGEQRPPNGFWVPLYAGDRIIVHHATGRIYLNFGGGPSITVCRKKTSPGDCDEASPYTVQAAREPGPVASLVHWAGDWLTGWWAIRPPEREREVRIRGPEIEVPLLDAPQVRLIAGRRVLRLAWQGGTPPYRLVIYRQGVVDPLVVRENIPVPRIKEETFAFEPDEAYSLELRDARGISWRKSFRVLRAEALPSPPPALDALPGKMRETLLATWLASQEDGAWIWEAYLLVAALPEDYLPATALRDALEYGHHPTSPH